MELHLKDTLNSAWKNDKSGFGFKMLQKMGWSEDKGLGKNETGITANIKISKREEGLGLGMDKTTDGAGAKGWNQTASSFNDVLSILKESYGSKSIKKKKLKAQKVDNIQVGVKYVYFPSYLDIDCCNPMMIAFIYKTFHNLLMKLLLTSY